MKKGWEEKKPTFSLTDRMSKVFEQCIYKNSVWVWPKITQKYWFYKKKSSELIEQEKKITAECSSDRERSKATHAPEYRR